MDKIYRIHSSISKMTYKDIQYIIDNMSVDFSVKIESSTCARPMLNDRKNSELSLTDPGSGSDKKKSELSHTNTSHTSEEQAPNESGVNISLASQPPIPRTNPTYDRTYFRKKILDQYPNLYREFSRENFDYYEITDETSCPLCKLGHDDEEIIEGRYKAGSYFIKCEQREIGALLSRLSF
jgi:hypothetical protein